jgi:uncharacterized protein YjbI with pentapeptide repeats
MSTTLIRWPGTAAQHSAELLRRYQAGERDFRGLYLQDLQLENAVLRGADFSTPASPPT